MSLFTFITNTREVARELKRIADALDRIAPPTGEPTPHTPAEADDISYASDEQTAKQELMDEISRYERELADEKDS